MTREVETFHVEDIRIEGSRLRPLNKETVNHLCGSIKSVGLRTPITVRMSDPNDVGAYPILVAGLHRLEAAKRLGMEQIEAFVADTDDEDRARLWEIAENLHRAELTVLERSEHIAEWVKLADKLSQVATVPAKGGRGNESGIRRAAREIGVGKDDAHRAVKVAALSPEAKEAAREAGLDDNQSRLLEVSRAPVEQQAGIVRQIAAAKAAKIAADPLDDTMASERQVARLMDAWNAAGPEARQEFLCRIDQPVMDRRFGS